MSGSPPLRTLLRLKLRGAIRRHVRRLKTPKGAVFTILGFVLIGLWLGGVAVSSLFGDVQRIDPEGIELKVALGAFVLTVLSISSALTHRGLFLPPEEIERLFSAPVRAAEIVRYRLFANSGRSLFGGVFVGIIAMNRMPMPLLAFLGIFLGMQTLPVFHQLVAILLGGLERKLASRLRTIGTVLFYVGLAAFGFIIYLLITGKELIEIPGLGQLAAALRGEGEVSPLSHPAVGVLTAPFLPWAKMISAAGVGTFLAWFGVCLLILVVLVEITARLPIDFRELSLETSASVAARLRRARRGGGAAAGEVSKRTAGWRIPWLFGRGSAGAVAWRKTSAILRKARGTFLVSSLVLLFVTVASTIFVDENDPSFVGPLFVAGLGTLYLCAGLRFDFRDDLDRMEVVKAWPVRPARLFFAMLLPEVFFVSLLLLLAVVLRASLEPGLHPVTVTTVALLPLVVFGWVALDNAVFLFAPVRFVPGQEGALQNAGRGVVLMLMRVLLVGMGAAIATAAFLATRLACESLGLTDSAALALGALAIWVTLFVFDALLVWAGGWLFRRFDVARDRG